VDLITKTPSALLSKLPFIYIYKENAGSFPPFLGTGPFRIVKWDMPKEVLLASFEGYWGPRPEVTKGVFRSVRDENQRMQMLAEGRADIAYYPPMAALQRKTDGVSVLKHAGLGVYYLGMDLKQELADARVRHAIHLAVNRQAIIRQALLGNGSVPTQPVAPFVFGYDPTIPGPEHDPAKARRLLEEAGLSGGFDLRLDFNQSRQDVAALVRNDLAKIGIRIALNGQNRNAVYELVEQGKSRFHLVGWDCSSGDASEFYEFNLHSRSETFGQGNYGGYSNAEMDSICEKHYFIMEEVERRKELQRAAQIAMRDLPVIPLFIEDDLYIIREQFGFEPRADGQIRIADVKRRR
jgi:ABC-type transport system substrate-binding protein